MARKLADRRSLNPHLRYERLAACYPFPILNIFVPQTVHVPWIPGLPFLSVTAFASLMSRSARHFKQ